MKLTPEQIERFWSKVDKKSDNECWEWLAGIKNKEGYGGFYIKQINNTMNSHKVSFIIEHNFNVDDISNGIVIRHSCNNPKCVNPRHLKLGTYKDNSQDMIDAGNSVCGVKNSKSKLTEEQVNEIRKLWVSGRHNQYEIAKIYNLEQTTISNIVLNKSYKDPLYQIPNIPHHGNKLDEGKVRLIKQMRLEGCSVKEITSKFGIGTSQLYNIVRERHWKNVS